jgi:N-formylglutamate amidohydrolase
MGRISGRAITHTRCFWKADQIVKSVEAYLRNGGYQDLRKDDFSKLDEAYCKLAKLRSTALTKAEYETFRRKIWRSIEAESNKQKSGVPREAANLVSSKQQAVYKKLFCDVERFPSDENEPMATRGMGVIYTHTSMRHILRAQRDPATRQFLLERWYWPHHSKLERMVNDVVARSGACLIVDCHSFPSIALPYELDQARHRSDFCIGTDPFHTPSSVRGAIVATIGKAGYSVTIDAPFAGALVPLASYRRDRRIWSVIIEVNRRLYMDEHTGVKSRAFEQVRDVVGQLITTAAEAAVRDLNAQPDRV